MKSDIKFKYGIILFLSVISAIPGLIASENELSIITVGQDWYFQPSLKIQFGPLRTEIRGYASMPGQADSETWYPHNIWLTLPGKVKHCMEDGNMQWFVYDSNQTVLLVRDLTSTGKDGLLHTGSESIISTAKLSDGIYELTDEQLLNLLEEYSAEMTAYGLHCGSICQIYPASAPGLPLPEIVTGRANVVSIKNYQIVLAYNIKPQNFRLFKELIKNTFVVKPDIYFDGCDGGVLKLIER